MGWQDEQEVKLVSRTLQPGKNVFMGTLRISNVTDPLFSQGTFDVELSDGSEQAEVLQWLIKTVDGTGWEQRLSQTLDGL